MIGLEELRATCPYCWEPLTLLVDSGDFGVDYVEDCQVCCRPIVVSARMDSNGEASISLRREDD
ncbi:MAG: CPXCG motif-containing cysteine-rich protein [Halieaceae bacterium]|nr:CPXCG motif-containing cysteine-rich protein [Halieaceae bacterium]